MSAEPENPGTPPSPRSPVKIGRLTSLRSVRCELARLYTDLRNGKVSSRIAGTGAYILTAITKSLEVEILEARVAVLEERAEGMEHVLLPKERRQVSGTQH